MDQREHPTMDPVQPQPQPQVNRISIKVPPFWKVDPKLWFIQLEAQFELAHITVDQTKYNPQK